MKKVSIIVPVYNGEKFIKRCLDSLTCQTYDNIEIIVINDGSSDNTLSLIKEYDNIVLIDKENTGVSDSRNIGLKKATGDYIMFCDADDWLEKDGVEIAVSKIGEFDILRYNYYLAKENDIKECTSDIDIYAKINKPVSADDLIESLLSIKTEGHISNYIFRKDIIKKNNIHFNTSLFYQEDVVFLLEYFVHSNGGIIIENTLYYYCINDDSVTHNFNSSIRNMCAVSTIRNTIADILTKSNNEKFQGIVEQKFLTSFLLYFRLYYRNLSKKEFYDVFDKIVAANYDYLKILNEMNFNKKWKVFIFLALRRHKRLFYIYVMLYTKITK